MTVQAFENKEVATKDELAEARILMEGLSFVKTRYCNDGYESWSTEVEDLDDYVELIKRARL